MEERQWGIDGDAAQVHLVGIAEEVGPESHSADRWRWTKMGWPMHMAS